MKLQKQLQEVNSASSVPGSPFGGLQRASEKAEDDKAKRTCHLTCAPGLLEKVRPGPHKTETRGLSKPTHTPQTHTAGLTAASWPEGNRRPSEICMAISVAWESFGVRVWVLNANLSPKNPLSCLLLLRVDTYGSQLQRESGRPGGKDKFRLEVKSAQISHVPLFGSQPSFFNRFT